MASAENEIPTVFFYCCDTDIRPDIMCNLQVNAASMEKAELNALKLLEVKKYLSATERERNKSTSVLP